MMQHAADPDLVTMQARAQDVVANLPAQFREMLGDVVVQVEEFATQEQLASVGMVDRWQLSGLYHGQPLTEQSVWDTPGLPPRIWLFRQPILAERRQTRVAIDDLIRHVVIHEAGHHFGFSDDDMHALEDTAD